VSDAQADTLRAQRQGRGKRRTSLPSIAAALEPSRCIYTVCELQSCPNCPKARLFKNAPTVFPNCESPESNTSVGTKRDWLIRISTLLNAALATHASSNSDPVDPTPLFIASPSTMQRSVVALGLFVALLAASLSQAQQTNQWYDVSGTCPPVCLQQHRRCPLPSKLLGMSCSPFTYACCRDLKAHDQLSVGKRLATGLARRKSDLLAEPDRHHTLATVRGAS